MSFSHYLIQEFFRTLFDDGQAICLADNKYAVDVTTLPSKVYKSQFYSINALDGYRKDENVTCFRNFLLEFDTGTETEHFEAMKSIPWSAAVFSGSKSTHFIISLEEPLYDAQEYRELALRLHAAIQGADPATKNPSRLSRTPGVLRKETGNYQKLLELKGRVVNKELLDVLPDVEIKQVSSSSKAPLQLRANINQIMFAPEDAINRLGLAGRNALFFWLGQRLIEANYESERCRIIVEQTYGNLVNKQDFSLHEALNAARLD